MAADPRVKVGVACIVKKGERYLLLQRSDHVSHGKGQWSLPGGWVEFGETPAQAAIRELQEETGLIANKAEYLGHTADTHPKEDLHVICLFFRMGPTPGTMWNPSVKEPDKAKDLGLFGPQDFPLDLFAPLRSFLEQEGWI